MYGTDYSNYSDIIIDSFKKTGSLYSDKAGSSRILSLVKPYIRIFGIPEIGFQLRAKYFIQALNGIKGFRPKYILDAGCGIGFYSILLADKYPKAEILGLDMDEDKLAFCKGYAEEQGVKNTKFKKGDITSYSGKGKSYDLIVNIDVLEHIEDYETVLKKFYKILKPGGYLYIHAPKINQTRLFKKYFANWEHEDHVREGFEPGMLEKDLKQIGFRKVVIKQGFNFWGKLAWELNHITMAKSFMVAGFSYPLIYLLSGLDKDNSSNGLSIIVLAKK